VPRFTELTALTNWTSVAEDLVSAIATWDSDEGRRLEDRRLAARRLIVVAVFVWVMLSATDIYLEHADAMKLALDIVALASLAKLMAYGAGKCIDHINERS
jgi:hypothetical protein